MGMKKETKENGRLTEGKVAGMEGAHRGDEADAVAERTLRLAPFAHLVNRREDRKRSRHRHGQRRPAERLHRRCVVWSR